MKNEINNKTKKNIKFIFFDMEGTLFKKTVKVKHAKLAPGAWPLIAQHLGEKAMREEEATKQKWIEGKFAGYVEWMRETIKIHQKYGLTKEYFEKVMSKIEYHDGVKEVFAELRKRNIQTGLVSGGFKAQADRASKYLKIDHAFAACEYYWGKDGKISHFNLLPCDYEGKTDFMKLIMKEHGLKKEEGVFVGDGANDIHLAQAVGTSIAFNASPSLQKVCTHVINQEEGKEDFRAVLKYLNF